MTKTVQGAQSFGRSIAVLQQIADAERPPSRAELAEASGLTRPTLYRIIASLEAEGMVEAAGGGYRLGARLVTLARTALAQNDIRRLAAPELERLRDATGETVHLAIPSGGAMTYIDKFESREVVRMISTIGTQVPLHSTSVGRAYLSALAEDEAEALIDQLDMTPLTHFTITDADSLKAMVANARAKGFSMEEQQNEEGITCFGAAIRDRAGAPVAAISVSVPVFRLGEGKAYGDAVSSAAKAISRQLEFAVG